MNSTIDGSVRNSKVGFTLIEVIAALAVMMLLVGGIYSIAGGALELSRSSGEARLVDLRLSNLSALWRRQLEALPTGAKLQVKRTEGGDRLLIIGASTLPLWTGAGAAADTTAFAVNDEGQLMLEQWSDARPVAAVALLPGVEGCRWEFYDEVEQRWLAGDQSFSGRRPTMAAVILKLVRDPAPRRYVFRVAPMGIQGLAGAGEGVGR